MTGVSEGLVMRTLFPNTFINDTLPLPSPPLPHPSPPLPPPLLPHPHSVFSGNVLLAFFRSSKRLSVI